MDSRSLKDSNEILFVIFRVTDQKLWFLQDWNGIWFENLFGILFEHRQATWRVLISWYRFGWICTEGRRIKRETNAPDLRIPLRVSDLILATRSRSNGRGHRGEGSPWKHTDGEVRRVWRSTTGCSGDLLALGRSGRGAGWCREDGSKIGGVDFFLERKGSGAGGAHGADVLRSLSNTAR
jgi:hypothetical protein